MFATTTYTLSTFMCDLLYLVNPPRNVDQHIQKINFLRFQMPTIVHSNGIHKLQMYLQEWDIIINSCIKRLDLFNCRISN